MSEKRRDGAWPEEVPHPDGREVPPSVISAAPERTISSSAAPERTNSSSSIGVAVIGAGMAGRAHAAAYRSAGTIEGPPLPGIRLVAVADLNPALADSAARRFGYRRAERDWQELPKG